VSEPPATPSYAELAALVAEQAVLIEALRAELEALRHHAGRDSSNSSQPPSTDGPAAKAKAKAGRRAAGREAQPAPDGQPPAGAPNRPRRKQGGQPGHRGSGLAPVTTPDRREPVEPPCCGGCGGDLAGAPGTVASRVQVFDLPCAMRRSVISPAQRGEIGGTSLDLMANPAPKGNIGNSSMPGN
jgi:transposase